MTTFFVLNHKKYRTSVRCADGRLESVRFEPEVYFGGLGESTYTTSDPEIIGALRKHPAHKVTFWQREESPLATSVKGTSSGDQATDPEALLCDPATATREGSVTSAAAARAWLQANLEYVVPSGMNKDDIKIEAAKRNVLFINW